VEEVIMIDQRERLRRSPRRGLRSASLIASALVALAVAVPAQAKPLEKERFSGTETFTECGYDIELTFSGFFMIKDATPSTDGQFFLFQTNFEYTETVTNPATGAFFTVSGNAISKEVQPRLVEGTVYTYQTLQAGQPFVVKDMNGRVVLRDRGAIRLSWSFDSLGDSEPGGENFEFLGVVRISGPHPGFEETFDFCALADELIG
jgi:hypothetical protein